MNPEASGFAGGALVAVMRGLGKGRPARPAVVVSYSRQAARLSQENSGQRQLAAAYRDQGADVGAVRLEDDVVAAFGANGVATVAIMLDRAAERRTHRISPAEPRVIGAVAVLPWPPAPDAVKHAAGIDRGATRLELRLGQFVARHAKAHHLPRDVPLEQLTRHRRAHGRAGHRRARREHPQQQRNPTHPPASLLSFSVPNPRPERGRPQECIARAVAEAVSGSSVLQDGTLSAVTTLARWRGIDSTGMLSALSR